MVSPIERVDATLRQIDATLAACEPNIARVKVTLATIEADRDAAKAAAERAEAALARALALETPQTAPMGPFRRFYASWLTIWRRLVWLACFEWLPERPRGGKGIVVVSDMPVIPTRPGTPGQPPADVND